MCYDRIELSKGIDVAKSSDVKESMICHYWFFNHRFQFQFSVCNGCHKLTMLSLNTNETDFVIV